MKRYTIGLILIIIIFNLTWAQSTVIFKNRVMWGEDSIDSVKGEVKIIDDNETITIKKRLQKQRTYDFSEILSIKDKNDKVIWSFEEYEREKFEILCDKNKNTKLLFVNLKDDVFGISDELYSLYDSTCFIMLDNYSILGFFDKNKLNRKEINDFMSKPKFKNEVEKLVAKQIKSGRNTRTEIVDIVSKVMLELYKTFWFRRSMWQSEIKRVR